MRTEIAEDKREGKEEERNKRSGDPRLDRVKTNEESLYKTQMLQRKYTSQD